jgi:hypothetical protein
MIQSNKELMILIDDDNYKRQPRKKDDNEHMILTYQEFTPNVVKRRPRQQDDIVSVREGVDQQGEFFVEYNFTEEEPSLEPDLYLAYKKDKMFTMKD